MAVTGCLHEDGLADTADGFGGGKSADRKLDIMRDSRIGTYGACALALSILLRTSALASLADTGLVVAALIAAHAAARATLPVVMFFVPQARSDGLSFAAGRPQAAGAAVGAALAFLILIVCLGPWLAIEAAIALAIVAALMARLSLSQIGGQTGDVLGAIEQVAEIVILLVALR
jgi:adenosylcobinamide-GDP ribazoletransferase